MRAYQTLGIASICLVGASGCDVVFGIVPGEVNPKFSVAGTIDTDTTWTADRNPVIEDFVRVPDGVTLTIDAGTRIFVKNPGGLFIDRGAKIIAKGTADAPIVFTSAEDVRNTGDWRGIFLCGKAPINGAPSGNFLMDSIPIGSNLACGGDDPNDSSGELHYVRIEFSGNDTGAPTESGGLELGGVGSGTLIDHIQIHRTREDGFNIYGGTVSLKYVLVTNHLEDGFDWSYGWQGKMQFAASIRDDGGFEGGNGSNDSYNDIMTSAVSNPTIYNATLIGVPNLDSKGLDFQSGAKGQFFNLLVADFGEYGVLVDSEATKANAVDGSLDVRNSIFSNAANFLPGSFPDGWSVLKWLTTDPPERNNTALPEGKHGIRSLEVTSIDLSLTDGAPGLTNLAATPPDDGFFDPTVNFIGACGATCPEFQGWTSFPAN